VSEWGGGRRTWGVRARDGWAEKWEEVSGVWGVGVGGGDELSTIYEERVG